jgi:hypothetical protein
MFSMFLIVHYVSLFCSKASRDGWLVGYSPMIGQELGTNGTDEFYNFLRVRDFAHGPLLRASFDSRPKVLYTGYWPTFCRTTCLKGQHRAHENVPNPLHTQTTTTDSLSNINSDTDCTHVKTFTYY